MSVAFAQSRDICGRFVTPRLLIVGLWIAGSLLAGSLKAESTDSDSSNRPDVNPALRPYRDGPLTAADFRCPPPNPLPQKNGVRLSAITYTRLNYSTRYVWQQAQANKVEARLTHFEIIAEVDRKKSWTVRPTDDRLLDHEQGHFDVTEMWARRIQQTMNALIAKGAFVGRGGDSTTAIADLNQKIDSRVKDLMLQEKKAQDEYDLASVHGRNYRVQMEQRRSQMASLRDTQAKKTAKQATSESSD